VATILRREISGLTYAQSEMIGRESPEIIAGLLVNELHSRGGSAAAAAFFFF